MRFYSDFYMGSIWFWRTFGPGSIWTGEHLDQGAFGPGSIWTGEHLDQGAFGLESIWFWGAFGWGAFNREHLDGEHLAGSIWIWTVFYEMLLACAAINLEHFRRDFR